MTDAPCAVRPVRTGAEDERPAIRRLAPLLRSLERHAGWRPGALCIGGRGQARYTIEQRAIEGEGSWVNPVRGVETTVWTDAFHPPVARTRQGEIDALAAIPFVSFGCRYGSNAEVVACGGFALTRPALRVR